MTHFNIATIFAILAITIGLTIATPVQIGTLSTHFHDVSGTVYAIDDRTFEIQSMVYDGQGPNTYFVAGTGSVSSNNFRLRVLPSCSGNILPAYNGDTVRIELPTGKTLADVDFISVWCEAFTVSFGDVAVSAGKKALIVPSSGSSACTN